MDSIQRIGPRQTGSPLYDARYEHDACGVGLRRGCRRPVARSGPAAGAGRPWRAGPSWRVRRRWRVERRRRGRAAAGSIAAGAARRRCRGRARPGIVSLFLPRGPDAERRARELVESTFAGGRAAGRPLAGGARRRRCPRCRGRRDLTTRLRPGDRRPPGPRAGRPSSDHRRGLRTPPDRRSPPARDRRANGRRPAGRAGRPVRLGPDDRLQGPGHRRAAADLYPDLRAPLQLSYAVFHQRYATNTHPVWRLAQPFRLISHNGEINTVRGNREEVRGRAGDATAGAALARELLAAGPLLSPGGSDSLSLDEALEAAHGHRLGADPGPARPRSRRRSRSDARRTRTSPRCAAGRPGFLAPWDGPAAIVFADGSGSAPWSTGTASARRRSP